MSSYYKQSDLTFFARESPDGRTGFWWLADGETWAEAKNDLKGSFNHSSGLRYDPDEREWTLPAYSIARLQRWASAWASREEWDAIPRNGERRQGHSECAQDAPGASLAQAYATLHLLPSAPPEVVQAAHRALVKTNHPDIGGSHAVMVSLNKAVDAIREVQILQARAS